MKRHGVVSKTQVITFKMEEASKEIAKSLQIHEKDLVYKLVRLRYTDYNPNVFITTYIPVSLFPGLLDTDCILGSMMFLRNRGIVLIQLIVH